MNGTETEVDGDTLPEALSLAVREGKAEAIEAWMTLLDTNNPMKRSCAEFNIAQACFLNGEYALALKWLDRSDADYPVSLSTNLRKRIQKAMH